MATGGDDAVEDGIEVAVGIGGTLHPAPPLATERGSNRRIYSNVWFPVDSPPTTKMCFKLGTTLIEWPVRGLVSCGKAVKTIGLSTDHGWLKSRAMVSSRMDSRPALSLVVPPEM